MSDCKDEKLDNTRIDLDATQILRKEDLNKTKVNIINEHKIDDVIIDEEMENSIRRLIEEETNVARAAYANDSENGSNNTVNNAVNSVSDNTNNPYSSSTGITEGISKDLLYNTEAGLESSVAPESNEKYSKGISDESGVSGEKIGNINIDNKDNNEKTDVQTAQAENTNKKSNKKKKIAIICAVVAVVIIAAVVISVVVLNNKKNSFDYNYNKGIEYFNDDKYTDAFNYFSKAYDMSEGKDNTELMEKMYLCCFKNNNDSKAIELIQNILDKDKYNKNAIGALGDFYDSNNKDDELNALIKKYRNTQGYDYLKKYVPDLPKPSIEAGTYSSEFSLDFDEMQEGNVYYTTDESNPETEGTKYTKSIKIGEGITKIKAVTKNAKGIYSDVVELTYTVTFKAPDAPVIKPESGTYDEKTTFSIDNLSGSDKAYYTLDGSQPDENSLEYTSPVEIPVGNTVVSVVIISENGTRSSVTRRNYVVKADVTYEEAVYALKNRMIELNELDSSGTQDNKGNSVSFVYQSKVTINDIELYSIRLDKKEGTKVKTEGYYGVGIKDKKCYKIVENAGSFTCTEY